MINLLLTGRAAPNVFNGDIEYNKNGRKLVSDKSVKCLSLTVVKIMSTRGNNGSQCECLNTDSSCSLE